VGALVYAEVVAGLGVLVDGGSLLLKAQIVKSTLFLIVKTTLFLFLIVKSTLYLFLIVKTTLFLFLIVKSTLFLRTLSLLSLLVQAQIVKSILFLRLYIVDTMGHCLLRTRFLVLGLYY
jgi:hypothetical protein